MTPARILTACLIVAAGSIAVGDADAATIVVSYERGHPDVLINGYRTAAMGTFRLDDGGTERLALCIEAHESHSTRQDAYALAGNRVASAELDALLWLIERDSALDDDRALASASLAWYYAGARRTIGPPVWSNGNRGFAPIGPLSPEPWDALAPFSINHMVGLRTGHTNLDRVERAIAALHRQVVSSRGPWSLDAIDGRFRLTGPGGPIGGQRVGVTVQPIDGEADEFVLVTDDAGWVDPNVGRPVDGAIVSAVADSPGVHQEWDGAGAIQRMSTATNRDVAARFDLAPLPRFVHVQKVSSDTTIGVAGGEFELFDAAGDSVGTAMSDPAGVARFEPIDPAIHAGPYELREIAAPPGLDRTAPDVRLAGLSSDSKQPTVVEMVDAPLTTPVQIRKRLSEPDVGPIDRSRFVFTIERRADGWADEAVTDSTGVTDPIALALGTYDVCEKSVPDWATTLVDGGCLELTIDLGTLTTGAAVEVDYVNVVPAPSIDTRASDPTDGNRELFTTGGPVVDTVELSGLVPGTSYELTGMIVDPASDGPALARAEAVFVAEAATAVIELVFELPPLPVGQIVITEQLLVAGRVAAEHADLDDPDQTMTVVAPPTNTTSTTTTSTLAVPPTTTSTVPAPSTTTITSTTSPSTTSPTATSPSTSTTSTTVPPVPATTLPQLTPPTLPRTGNDAAATLLRLGDVGFVLGVALVALVSFLPRRQDHVASRY